MVDVDLTPHTQTTPVICGARLQARDRWERTRTVTLSVSFSHLCCIRVFEKKNPRLLWNRPVRLAFIWAVVRTSYFLTQIESHVVVFLRQSTYPSYLLTPYVKSDYLQDSSRGCSPRTSPSSVITANCRLLRKLYVCRQWQCLKTALMSLVSIRAFFCRKKFSLIFIF